MENQVPEEVQKSIKTILDHFEKEDQYVRDRQIRQWKRLKLYWEGIQKIWYDETAHDWKIYDEETLSGDNDAAYYDKPVNIFRAYLESIIAALSISIPGIECAPDDADNSLDLDTAQAGNKIAKQIYKHNDVSLLWLHALFIFCTEGLVGCYRYSKEDEAYGTYEVPVMSKGKVNKYLCPSCSSELPPELPENCPQCQYPIPLDLETTEVETEVIKKFETKFKARQVLEVYGGLYIKVPNYAKKQGDCPYLIWLYETHYSNVIARYPHLRDKIKGDTGPPKDTYEAWARLSPEYRSEQPMSTVTVKNVWLRPSAYNVGNKEQTDELTRRFPKGCKAVFANDLFCEAIEESLDDCWTLTCNPLADYIHFNPLGLLLVSVQDISNDLIALTLQTIEQGIPQNFADPTVLNFDAYKQEEATPGMVYPTKPQPSNKSIAEAFHSLKTAALSPEVMPFGNSIQSLGQLVSGALPSLFGGLAEAGSKTASEYSMSRAQALQRLQNVWKMFNVWWKQIFEKAIPAYINDMMEDEKFTEKGINGNWMNVFIRKSETQGKIGEVTLTASEHIPLTIQQKKDVLIQLMQFAGDSPQFIAIMSSPENLPFIKEALGLEELLIPGEDDRQKQYEEIQQLIISEPIMQEPDPLLVQAGQLIGEQPQGMELPSVPIDPMVDNHQIEADICRVWLVSDVGRDAKVTNPPGYRNVVLHMIEHIKAMQPQIAPTATGATGDQQKPPVAQEELNVNNLPIQ